MSIKNMALEANAMPFGSSYLYGGDEAAATWDENKIYGCVCDSAWSVGYEAGKRQTPQWFGPDCSLKHCPSGDDPRTADVVETDCEWADDNGATWRAYVGADGKRYKTSAAVTAAGTTVATSPAGSVVKAPAVQANAGEEGNLCHVDCSNRGICDYATGTCACFKGYAGENCAAKMPYF
jgi:hypothetical protein